ncbi:MAG: EAL domain-containing protein [Clostridiales bacterium]|nr:EAL domain-containing protein [Clostridiales bacterium]
MTAGKKIALLTGRPDETSQAEFIKGFEQKAFAMGFDVYVFAMYRKYQNTAAREAGETSVFDLVRFEDYDGIILMSEEIRTPGLADLLEELCRRHARGPVITVEKTSSNFPQVMADHHAGIGMITEYLARDCGYRDIAFVTEGQWLALSQTKVNAFRQTMASLGLAAEDKRIIRGKTGYEGGRNAALMLMKAPEGLPQAVLCADDELAAGVCDALIGAGYKIPEDIAVAGYDSKYLFSNEDAITSVAVSRYGMGSGTADALIKMMSGEGYITVPTDLRLIRGSTTPQVAANDPNLPDKDSLRKRKYGVEKISDTVPDYLCEDMMSRESLYDLLNTLMTYAGSLDDADRFMLYLNDERKDAPSKPASVPDIQEDEPDPYRFYTPYMLKALTYNRTGPGSIGADVYFDRRDIIYEKDCDGIPEGFIITPLFFEDRVFGYAVRASHTPGVYSGLYRYRLRDVMLGLENLSRSEDVRRQTKALEDRLIRDPLTGLYNYRGYTRHADSVLFRFRKLGAEHIGVLAIDIKGLSEINNTEGRNVGDEVLSAVANMIRKIFSNSGVFMFGGDEFIVVSPLGSGGLREFDRGIIKLGIEMDAFNKEKEFKNPVEFYYGTAIGRPIGRKDLSKLISEATVIKKEKKKTRLLASTAKIDEDSETAKQIDEIIETNAFKYMFQPIVDSSTGTIFAYEALMRTDLSPELTPDVILDYAKRTGRLYEIEKETIGNVLAFVSEHSDYFSEGARIFINSIPGNHLSEDDMSKFSQVTAKTSNKIVIELTEHGQMTDEQITNTKKLYEKLGMETAIDDYGTGYSNTGNLLRYMPDYVKIDRLLLTDIDKSPAKQRLVSDTISFCHENGIKSLAEGIETFEEMRTVIRLGADLLQGYYLARPQAVIPRELTGSITEEIRTVHTQDGMDSDSGYYIAGLNPVIRLSDFDNTNVENIRIPASNDNCTDLVISGFAAITGSGEDSGTKDSQMTVTVEDGYKGVITLNNARLSGSANGIAVDIGQNCEVTLILKRNNELTGGIRVPESSTLAIEGDGNLAISVAGGDVFGIGNSSEKGCGRLLFEQDGTIDINIDAANGTAIGSGSGGIIEIRRGRYDIRLSGAKGTAIGSINGPVDIRISDCVMEIVNNLQKGVSVGSVYGDSVVSLEHISFTVSADTSEGAGIGTVSGKAEVSVVSGKLSFTAKGTRYMAIGSCSSEDVVCKTEYISFEGDVAGDQTGLLGSLTDGARVTMVKSLIEGTLKNETGKDINAKDEDIMVMNGRTRIIVNDKVCERINGQ